MSVCPKGHTSEADDFCDTCGAKIPAGAHAAPPTEALPTAAMTAADLCPHCGAPQLGSGRFCEDCGFDHSTGKMPAMTAPLPMTATMGVAATIGAWTATVQPDRAYFEENAIEGVTFPADTAPRTVTLPEPQVRIGRRSTSKGTNPEIDLADSDPGVSHSHALLTLSVDGSWLVSDLGSTNGTYLNDEQHPLTAGQTRALRSGDRVHVGAWTTITLRAPAA